MARPKADAAGPSTTTGRRHIIRPLTPIIGPSIPASAATAGPSTVTDSVPAAAPDSPAATGRRSVSFATEITGPSAKAAGPSETPSKLDLAGRILAADNVASMPVAPRPGGQSTSNDEDSKVITIPRLHTPSAALPQGLSSPLECVSGSRHKRSSSSQGTYYGISEARLAESILDMPLNEDAVFPGETGGSRGGGLFCREQTPSRRRIIYESHAIACDLVRKRKRRCVFHLELRDVQIMWESFSVRDKEQLKKSFWKLRFIPSRGKLGLFSLRRLRSFLLEYGFESHGGRKRVLIYKLASQINHACIVCANAEFIVDGKDSTISISVIKELNAGDEIMINYGRSGLPCCVCNGVTTMEVVGSTINKLHKSCTKPFWHGEEESVPNVHNMQERGPRSLARSLIETKKEGIKRSFGENKDYFEVLIRSTGKKVMDVFSKSTLEQTLKTPKWARKLFKKDTNDVSVEPGAPGKSRKPEPPGASEDVRAPEEPADSEETAEPRTAQDNHIKSAPMTDCQTPSNDSPWQPSSSSGTSTGTTSLSSLLAATATTPLNLGLPPIPETPAFTGSTVFGE